MQWSGWWSAAGCGRGAGCYRRLVGPPTVDGNQRGAFATAGGRHLGGDSVDMWRCRGRRRRCQIPCCRRRRRREGMEVVRKWRPVGGLQLLGRHHSRYHRREARRHGRCMAPLDPVRTSNRRRLDATRRSKSNVIRGAYRWWRGATRFRLASSPPAGRAGPNGPNQRPAPTSTGFPTGCWRCRLRATRCIRLQRRAAPVLEMSSDPGRRRGCTTSGQRGVAAATAQYHVVGDRGPGVPVGIGA